MLGADGEHARQAPGAAEDLYRRLADGPRMQAAHGSHAQASVAIDTLDDHADLVLVRHHGDAAFLRLPSEVHDDAVRVVLPDVISQVAEHLQHQVLDFRLCTGWTVGAGQAFEIGEKSGAVDGHGSSFGVV